METESKRPKEREGAISVLDSAIGALNFVEKNSSIAPAKIVFTSVSALLTTIRVRSLLFCNDLL